MKSILNRRMKVIKCPSDELAHTHCVFCKYTFDGNKYVQINTCDKTFVFTLLQSDLVDDNEIALNASQRRWTLLKVNDTITVTPYDIHNYIESIVINVQPFKKQTINDNEIKLENLINDFKTKYLFHSFTIDEPFIMNYNNILLSCTIKLIYPQISNVGLVSENTVVLFESEMLS